MTPLLQYPCTGHLAGDDMVGHAEEMEAMMNFMKKEPSRPLLEATHGNLHLIRYLRLPQLPSEGSCYSLNDKWACREVKLLLALFEDTATKTRPVRVASLLKAAIMASVMLF